MNELEIYKLRAEIADLKLQRSRLEVHWNRSCSYISFLKQLLRLYYLEFHQPVLTRMLKETEAIVEDNSFKIQQLDEKLWSKQDELDALENT